MQQGLYLRMLQAELRVEVEVGGTLLFMDNHSAIKLAKNPEFYKSYSFPFHEGEGR